MAAQSPTISVVLPTFNAASFLPAAIDSILNQSYHDFELIVVDDGSVDETARVLSGYRDPRLRVVKQPHRGLVAALNTGLSLARGRYIARMDADDWSHPERLARQLMLLQADPRLAAAGCGVEMFPPASVQAGMQHYLRWLNSQTAPERIARDRYVEMPLLHPSMLFRKEAILQVGGYRQGDFPEDYDLFLRLHYAGWRFAKVPDILFFWREHDQRLSRHHAAYRADAFRRLKAEMLSLHELPPKRRFAIWGAGRDGRRFCRELLAFQRCPKAFIDIDPRKIGRRVYGIPVQSRNELPEDDHLVLVCVGCKGAREEIRGFLLQHGRVEGQNFLCVT